MEEIIKKIIKERNDAIDQRIKYMLDKYNLPYDRKELENMGYVLVSETTPISSSRSSNSFKSSHKYKLCKIQDTISFDIICNTHIQE